MDIKAVSRRVGPVSDNKSFTVKRAVPAAPAADTTNGTASTMNRPPSPNRGRPPKKRIEDHIEMRPLLFGAGPSEEIVGAKSPAPRANSTNASPAHHSAQQFADTWLGGYVKLKAKQAEKHVYNLRASLKSKKGFHVQMPKRILFYSVLVFLVLPLILFIIKETHIHDHDPAFHVGRNHTHGAHYRSEDAFKSDLRPSKKHRIHPSLQQLLAGGLPPNSTISNSRSRDPSGDVVGRAPESVHRSHEAEPQAEKTVAFDADSKNISVGRAGLELDKLPLDAVPVESEQKKGVQPKTTSENETPDAELSASKRGSPISSDNAATTMVVVGTPDHTNANGTRLPGNYSVNITARRRRRRRQ